MSIHAFGAYFGLAVAMFVASEGSGSSHPKNGASYNSDMTAMIGTIFLFIFWPSFNGALASNPDVTVSRCSVI
jgi:ammonium transporter Rh